jgi:hypothetical protein
MKKLKIVHVQGYWGDNLAYQENYLTQGQLKLGHDVYVITSKYEIEMKSNKGNRIMKCGESVNNGIKIIRLSDYFELKKNALVLVKNIMPEFKKIKPDIIFFHDVMPTLLHGVIYKFYNPKVKLQIDFHSDFNNAYKSKIGPLYHFFYKLFFKLFINKFDKFFPIAPDCKVFIKKIYSIPESKIVDLPLPGDSSILEFYESERKNYRNKLKLTDDNIVLVHTGKLPEEKETLLVLESFKKIKNKNYRLIIAGSIDNSFEKTFNRFLKNDNRIIFIGWISPIEMKKLFCASDVMLQPGSLSQIFVDAICCGLPIILNNTAQGKSLTSHNNGLLIHKKDTDSIISSIKNITHKNNYNEFKKNSIIAAKYYDHVNNAKITLN